MTTDSQTVAAADAAKDYAPPSPAKASRRQRIKDGKTVLARNAIPGAAEDREQKEGKVKAQIAAARTRSALLGRPGFLIRRLHQIHISLFLAETESFGITPVQYSLLTALDQHGELDQNTVALEVGLERTTVAEVIPRLEIRGFLERRQSETDRRVKLVKLSRKGRSLVRRMETAVQRAHDRTIDHLPPEDRERFLLYLIQLVEAKNDHGSVPFRLP